jgi:hypothetical protein
LPEQAVLFRMQSFPGSKQIREVVLSGGIGWNKAHLQAQ